MERLTPALERVRIRNFKSIEQCDVALGPVSFLVGPNASGKSNFLAALQFLSVLLESSLGEALREGGGMDAVRRHSSANPDSFSIAFEARLPGSVTVSYEVEIVRFGSAIGEERCRIVTPVSEHGYYVRDGQMVERPFYPHPSIPSDRLYLTRVLSEPAFESLHAYIMGWCMYDLHPGKMRELQDPKVSDFLAFDGSNSASIWKSLEERDTEKSERVQDFLKVLFPEILHVRSAALGPKRTLEFTLRGAGEALPFHAWNMSDGTLRALGILLALYQTGEKTAPTLMMFEEPERGVHPAAMGVILDAIVESSLERQIIVTSHSPDLLDRSDVEVDSIIAVTYEEGRTIIGPIDDIGRSILRDRLYTAGELLRMGQVRPSGAHA